MYVFVSGGVAMLSWIGEGGVILDVETKQVKERLAIPELAEALSNVSS